MSFTALNWAPQQKTGGPGEKVVLLMLASMADENESCYPSQKYLAKVTDQSVRSVRGHLASLEEAGLIRREHRRRADGTQTSDRFILLLAAESAAGANQDDSDIEEVQAAESAYHESITTINSISQETSFLDGRSPTKRSRRTKFVPDLDADDPADNIWATPGDDYEEVPTRSRKAPDPDTPLGLAETWATEVASRSSGWGKVLIGHANKRALAHHFKDWLAVGVTADQIRAMIDYYVTDPGEQAGDKPAWVDFLAKRQHLLDKVTKVGDDPWATDWSAYTTEGV